MALPSVGRKTSFPAAQVLTCCTSLSWMPPILCSAQICLGHIVLLESSSVSVEMQQSVLAKEVILPLQRSLISSPGDSVRAFVRGWEALGTALGEDRWERAGAPHISWVCRVTSYPVWHILYGMAEGKFHLLLFFTSSSSFF